MTAGQAPKDLLSRTIEQLGYEVNQIHDDLVFVSPNHFIFKRCDTPYLIELYFNEHLEAGRAEELMAGIESAGLENSLIISYKGAYCITHNDDQTLSVEFFDLTDESR